MKYALLIVGLLATAPIMAGEDLWHLQTETGWKGSVWVDVNRRAAVRGYFVARNGARCDILSGQTFDNRDIRGTNIAGAIGTTCGVWDVWKGRYAYPAISMTTGDRSHPFGRLFTGRIIFK